MYNNKKIFDFGFNVKNIDYDISKLAYICNIAMIFILLLFSSINIFIGYNIKLGIMEFLLVMVALGVIQLYKKHDYIEVFLLSTTTLLFIVSISFYFNSERTTSSYIWIFFFPLVVFLLNGLKMGKIFTTIYSFIIITHLYLGIGTYTDFGVFINVSFGLLVFSLLAYLFEYSRKEAFRKMINSINKLEEISHLDELTKLYNRHFLNNKILENKELNNKPVMFCLTDVDNFKAYNDYYGHQKGDDALQQIADAKKRTIGSYENHFIVRLGGEEFGGFMFDSVNLKRV